MSAQRLELRSIELTPEDAFRFEAFLPSERFEYKPRISDSWFGLKFKELSIFPHPKGIIIIATAVKL